MHAVPSIIPKTQTLGKCFWVFGPPEEEWFFHDYFFSYFPFVVVTCSHHPVFGAANQAALSMLSSFMNVPNLPPNSDVLENLKRQVGLMDPEFSLHALRNLSTPPNSAFTLPQNGATGPAPQNLSAATAMTPNGFSFTPPSAAAHTKDGNFVFVEHIRTFIQIADKSLIFLLLGECACRGCVRVFAKKKSFFG